jgi:hypothetical protein
VRLLEDRKGQAGVAPEIAKNTVIAYVQSDLLMSPLSNDHHRGRRTAAKLRQTVPDDHHDLGMLYPQEH